MILSALMAAAITVGTPQADNNVSPFSSATEKEAMLMTYVLLVCRPHLDSTLWNAWLPLASRLGVDDREVAALRENIAWSPPARELNETICVRLASVQFEKIKGLLGQGELQEEIMDAPTQVRPLGAMADGRDIAP